MPSETHAAADTRTAADVISQDEVDALFEGVRSGAVPTGAGRAPTGPVQPYDFAAAAEVARGPLAMLDAIDERLALGVRDRLERLVHRSPEVTRQPVERLRYGEFIAGARMPTATFVLQVKPLAAPVLLLVDAALVGSITDAFYGGSGRHLPRAAGVDFTPAEWRLARRCVDDCLDQMREAWSPVVTLEPEIVRVERNPQLAGIVPASETVLVRRFTVQFESPGEIALVLPLAALDSLRDRLQSPGVAPAGPRLRQDLEDALYATEIEVEAQFAQIDITLRALVGLRAGDIMEIERPESVLVLAAGRPLFCARFGTSAGCNALQFMEPASMRPGAAGSGRNRRSQ